MMRSITNVIFGLTSIFCLLIGSFLAWFAYEYSLKWEFQEGVPVMGANSAIVFAGFGRVWLISVAAGWLLIALVFWVIHRRFNRPTSTKHLEPPNNSTFIHPET